MRGSNDMRKLGSLSMIDNEEAPALPSNLKIVNRVRILNCFRSGKTLTISEVSEQTGISKITVMRAVQFFCGKGVLEPQGKVYQNNSGGKYPETFRMNIEKFILNITVWSATICFTLMDFAGNVIEREEYHDVDTHRLEMEWIESFILDGAKRLLEKTGVKKDDVYGVAVSVSGIIDYEKREIKYNTQASEWGNHVQIMNPLFRFFGEDTYYFLENGGKIIARTFLRNPAVGNRRTLILTTTWGIGGCLLRGGRVLNGKNSLIGEVGHMIIDRTDTERCKCGSCGCLERMVDIRRIRKDLKENPPAEGSLIAGVPAEKITMRDLFSMADREDERARAYVAYLAECFATALRNISLVFDPELVFFIGEYAYAGDWFDQCLKQKLREFRYYIDGDPFEVIYEKKAMLEMDYEGAAVAVTDHFFNNLELYED